MIYLQAPLLPSSGLASLLYLSERGLCCFSFLGRALSIYRVHFSIKMLICTTLCCHKVVHTFWQYKVCTTLCCHKVMHTFWQHKVCTTFVLEDFSLQHLEGHFACLFFYLCQDYTNRLLHSWRQVSYIKVDETQPDNKIIILAVW